MADENLLYEYKRTEDTDDEFRIACSRRSVGVFRRKGFDYTTEKEVFRHFIEPDELDGFGVTISCDNKDIYGGSASFSFSSRTLGKIQISDIKDKYISVRLEFK